MEHFNTKPFPPDVQGGRSYKKQILTNLWQSRSCKILLFSLIICVFAALDVQASHFRGGTITWQQAGGNTITFTVNTQWRRSFFGGRTVGSSNNIGTFYFGDGTTATMIATVNAINTINDESFMTWTITKTYATVGNFTASAFTNGGGLCCRINGVLDGNNGGYKLETVVNVGGPPFNNPPVTSLPAIVNLPVGATNATFTIPGSDPDNDPLTFRVSTAAESGLSTIQPAGFSLSSNGIATMNTTSRVVGNQFAVQVMILDGRSKTPVDFIIRMVEASAPPVFVAPSPAQNAVFNVTPPGNSINFTVAATDPDAGQTTTLNSVALPLGASMSPTLPVTSSAGGVIQSTFNWTPTAAQVGSYVINFVAQDNVGIQSFRTVTINVQCPLSTTVTGSVTPTCIDTNDGSISVSVQNFSTSSNLRYLWTGPGAFTSTQQNLSGLSSGTYNLRVDDVGTGCFSLTTVALNSVNVPPTIVCPENITVNATSANGAVVNYTAPVGTDNCTGAVTTRTAGPASGATFPIGETTVTHRVTDAAGLTADCSFTVTVTGVAPSIVVPANITENNTPGQCGASVSFSATETVGIPASAITYSIAPGSTFPVGTTTVTATATNAVGSSSNTFTVTVTDNVKPVITTNGDKSVNNDAGACSGAVTVSASATDNCSVGTPTGVRSDALALTAPYPVGTTTIKWNVTDINGNVADEVTQTVTVTDNVKPVITTNGDKSVNNDAGACSGAVTVSASATDNCSVGIPTGVRSDALALTAPYPVGTTTIKWNVTDINGNVADEVTQTVTVTDNVKPVITSSADITQPADAGNCSAVVTITNATATDNCSVGAVTGTRSDALALTAPYPVGTTTITWNVTDVNGNAADEVVQTVTITNNAPAITLITAPNIPQPLGTAVPVSAAFVDENIESATWTAYDGNAVVQTFTIPATGNSTTYTFNNLPAGVYTIILKLEDYCGLTTTQEFQFVTVYDPNGGFVTGGGWIYSKPGDYVTNPIAEGKANFGFVAKYKTGKNQVDQVEGNTNFQFKEGDFHFKSTSHESMSLVISGAKATYRGIGTVNGMGSHKFMITVIDGDLRGTTDKFRIRVWADGSSSVVIYDNEFSAAENAESTTELGGGSIVIHKPAAKGNKRVVTDMITVAWNTPVETIKQKVDQMSATWFESRKLSITLDASSYDPLTPGFYELNANVVENEFFKLDEPISIQVLVQDKPQALDVTISNDKLAKDTKAGQEIGVLNTIDPVDNIHNYTIAANEDLILDGNKLIWKGTTIPARLDVTVFSTDRAGQTISREIKLSRELKPGEFFLYPNPAIRETNVMVDLDTSATVAIKIYDSIGKLVVENEAYREGDFTQAFNLDGLAPGMYTVQVKAGDIVMTKRLIKK